MRVCKTSCFSRARLFATLRTVAHQGPLSVGFTRQEYWRKLPCSSPGDLPDPGIKPTSLTFPALAGRHLPLEPLVGACKHTAVPRLHKRQTTKSPLCKRRAKCLNYREWHCPLTSSKCNIFTWFLSGTTHSQNK